MDGVGLGAIGAGALFLYSGIQGKSITAGITGLVRGQNPASLPVVNSLAQPPASPAATTAQTNSDSAYASAMLAYVGKVPYVWGGASPVTGWDCSGSCNYVICHDCNHAIPGNAGGTFNGTSHGPATLTWLAWGISGNMQKLTRADVVAGDIVLWQTHMGIAVNSTDYASATDVQSGTTQGPIDSGGPAGEVATYWRLT